MIRLLLPLALAASPMIRVSPDSPGPSQAELPSFKDDIDHSIRWLRSQQERLDGSYGDTVSATSVALIALALSPRAYRRADGPFVARALDFLIERQDEDGWIARAELPESERAEVDPIRDGRVDVDVRRAFDSHARQGPGVARGTRNR